MRQKFLLLFQHTFNWVSLRKLCHTHLYFLMRLPDTFCTISRSLAADRSIHLSVQPKELPPLHEIPLRRQLRHTGCIAKPQRNDGWPWKIPGTKTLWKPLLSFTIQQGHRYNDNVSNNQSSLLGRPRICQTSQFVRRQQDWSDANDVFCLFRQWVHVELIRYLQPCLSSFYAAIIWADHNASHALKK